MPIGKLFVEGALEVEVLNPVLLGNPAIQQGGSKNALKARAGTDRRENQTDAGYLRDRDFDFYPPDDLTKPTVDSSFEGTGIPFGWRWCRHELENYLIDPAVVSEAMHWPAPDVEAALRNAASTIRYYEAARWAIGIARRSLPPQYELRTRPEGLNEIELPPALEAATVNNWAFQSIADHRARIAAATEPTTIQESLDALTARFDDAFIDDTARVLIWFSGKDLLAGLAAWILVKGFANPGVFRSRLRDWIIANPERTVDLLPEWGGLIQVVRA